MRIWRPCCALLLKVESLIKHSSLPFAPRRHHPPLEQTKASSSCNIGLLNYRSGWASLAPTRTQAWAIMWISSIGTAQWKSKRSKLVRDVETQGQSHPPPPLIGPVSLSLRAHTPLVTSCVLQQTAAATTNQVGRRDAECMQLPRKERIMRWSSSLSSPMCGNVCGNVLWVRNSHISSLSVVIY